MIKHQLLTILLLSSMVGGSLFPSTATSGEFDMFSFFSKKSVSTTSIHDSVGAELTELASYPSENSTQAPATGQCQKIKLDVKASKDFSQVPPGDNSLEVSETGFSFVSANGDYAFVNNADEFRFDTWKTDQSALLNVISVKGLEEESSRWISYSVVDVACLTKNRLLVAISYHDPRPKLALYLYDIDEQRFSLFSQAETNAQDHYDYFEQLSIGEEQSLIKYYSDTKRKSAEIYHNYVNHVVLFNKAYPEGLEILKLGIDDGNIKAWQVKGKTLLMKTLDNRNHQSPVNKNWSLDLSRVLAQ